MENKEKSFFNDVIKPLYERLNLQENFCDLHKKMRITGKAAICFFLKKVTNNRGLSKYVADKIIGVKTFMSQEFENEHCTDRKNWRYNEISQLKNQN